MLLSTTSTTWPTILDNIRSRVSKQQFATWFQNLQAYSQTDDEVNIRVPHQFFKEWLTHNYLDVISDAIFETTGTRPQVAFTIDDSVRAALPRQEDSSSDPEPVVLTDLSRMRGMRLNDQYTFDSFVVGHSNQLAHAAAQAVTASLGTTYNPLFMHGSVGLGKSHLLQAICHGVLARSRLLRVAYLSCETFVNEFISAIQKNHLPAFRARYRELDLLLLDDIQFLTRAERSQEEFFHTFNDLYNAQKQIVLSSDQPPNEITGFQDRMTSRFKSGLVARIDPPSYEMRVAILKKKADSRGVNVPDNVIEFIASTVTSNIRELDGGITKVVGYASLLNQPITMDVARTALDEPAKPKTPITIEDITRAVTEEFQVKLSDLQSKKRTRSIVYPRQICMYLARSYTMLSLEEIGRYFGGRDHSTVLHAEDKIRKKIDGHDNPGLLRHIDRIRHSLNIATDNGR